MLNHRVLAGRVRFEVLALMACSQDWMDGNQTTAAPGPGAAGRMGCSGRGAGCRSEGRLQMTCSIAQTNVFSKVPHTISANPNLAQPDAVSAQISTISTFPRPGALIRGTVAA